MAFEYRELQDQLLDVGRKLADPPASVDQLISLLTRADSCLARVEQSPKDSMRKALDPTLKALVEHRLLRHPDTDVQVALASCITEITRITAPDAPYDDDQMKEIFQLVVSSFEKLHDISSRSYAKRRAILETVAKVRSCVVMLDLECDGLILEMFQHFLKAIREHHPENVFSSMETIMTLVLEESEEISFDLLSPLLDSIKKDNEEVSPIARKLAERVIENCTTKLKPYLVQAVRMLDISVDDYSKVLASICQDTCDSLEKNGVCVTSDHKEEEIKSAELPPEESSPEEESKSAELPPEESSPEDETKSAELPLEESSPVVVKEEDAHSPQDNQEGNRSSKSVTNNGVASAGEDATLGDHKSITKTEDTDFSDHSKEELNDLGDGKVDKNERKPEQATKKSRRKSSSSTKSAKLSQCQAVANEKKAEKMLDSESYSKEAHNDESEVVASPSPSDSLPYENHSEKLGKAKTKGSPANVEVVSKKVSEGASISKAKPVKRPVKKTLGRSSGVKKTAGTDSDKTQSGAVSSADAKKHSAKKLNDNEGGGGSSSRQLVDEKKLGWGEANSETGAAKSSSVGVDKEMVSSPRSDTKSSENEKLEETTKTSAKRKHALEDEKLEETPKTSAKRKPAEDEKLGETPKTSAKRKPASGRKNGSGVKEYGENLVGLRVEVWWPKDREFYKGVIERFDPIKKKHKVVYDDGEVEVLNLSRQKWNIIEADSVADGEEGSDHASLDASPEMPTKKKGKTSFGEPTKHGKLSSSGGASGSSKSKSVLMSGQKSKDGNKSKESNTVSDSEDEVSRKFKDNTPASAAPKITSKSKNIGSSKTSKPKDNDTITPKPSVKSKQETSKSGATNQKTPKTAASEGKPPNSGGKSSVDRGGKLKSGSLKKRVLEDDDSDDSAREEEYTKGKTSGSSKAEGSEVKRGNKRQRS